MKKIRKNKLGFPILEDIEIEKTIFDNLESKYGLWINDNVVQFDDASKVYGQNKIFTSKINLDIVNLRKVGELEKIAFRSENIIFSKELEKEIQNKTFDDSFDSEVYLINSPDNKGVDYYFGKKWTTPKFNFTEYVGKIENFPVGLLKNNFYSLNLFENNNIEINKKPRIRSFNYQNVSSIIDMDFDKEKCKVIDEEIKKINIRTSRIKSNNFEIKDYKEVDLDLFLNREIHIINNQYYGDKRIMTDYNSSLNRVLIGKLYKKLPNHSRAWTTFDGSLNYRIRKSKDHNEVISTKIHLGLDQTDTWRYVIGDQIIVDKYFKDSIENAGIITQLPLFMYKDNFFSYQQLKQGNSRFKQNMKII